MTAAADTRPPLIRLQYVGWVAAVPAERARVGDEVMWNNGGRSTIVDIQPKGSSSLSITFETEGYGRDTRIKRRTGLMAVIRDGKWLGVTEAGTR